MSTLISLGILEDKILNTTPFLAAYIKSQKFTIVSPYYIRSELEIVYMTPLFSHHTIKRQGLTFKDYKSSDTNTKELGRKYVAETLNGNDSVGAVTFMYPGTMRMRLYHHSSPLAMSSKLCAMKQLLSFRAT